MHRSSRPYGAALILGLTLAGSACHSPAPQAPPQAPPPPQDSTPAAAEDPGKAAQERVQRCRLHPDTCVQGTAGG
jgi:hypothetical protein